MPSFSFLIFEIPENVSSIGKGAFTSCRSLKKVTVNSANKYYSASEGVLFNKDKTILMIYPAAKAGSSYRIPDSVKKVSGDAFEASKLSEVEIGKSVKILEHDAFSMCEELSTLKISEGLEKIEDRAFSFCSSLKTVALPDSLLLVGESAFYNSGLENVYIGSGIKTIKQYAFQQCALDKVIFMGDAPTIRGYAFIGETATVYVPTGNTSWTEDAKNQVKNHIYNTEITWKTWTFKAPKITDLTNKKAGSINATWKKVSGVSGYQLQVSTSKSFAKKRTVLIKGKTNVTTVLKDLKKGTRYYVRVRSYKSAGTRRYYTQWSGAKSLLLTK